MCVRGGGKIRENNFDSDGGNELKFQPYWRSSTIRRIFLIRSDTIGKCLVTEASYLSFNGSEMIVQF